MAICTETRHVTPKGGNVFADLGFAPNEAVKLKIKAELMLKITVWIKDNGLNQSDAAAIFGIQRTRVSDLMRGKIQKFTIDALVDMLEKARQSYTITTSFEERTPRVTVV